jgi:hypothetical protein
LEGERRISQVEKAVEAILGGLCQLLINEIPVNVPQDGTALGIQVGVETGRYSLESEKTWLGHIDRSRSREGLELPNASSMQVEAQKTELERDISPRAPQEIPVANTKPT